MKEEYLNTITILKEQKNTLNECLKKSDNNIQKKMEIIDSIIAIDTKLNDYINKIDCQNNDLNFKPEKGIKKDINKPQKLSTDKYFENDISTEAVEKEIQIDKKLKKNYLNPIN